MTIVLRGRYVRAPECITRSRQFCFTEELDLAGMPARLRDILADELLLASRLDTLEHLDHTEDIDLLALLAEEGARSTAEVSGTPVCIQGDPRMLRRLMHNLFENARRYAAGSPIEASVLPLHPTGHASVLPTADPACPHRSGSGSLRPSTVPLGCMSAAKAGAVLALP